MAKQHACECCDTEAPSAYDDHNHGEHSHDEHHHEHGDQNSGWKSRLPLLLALAILGVMLVLEFAFGIIPPRVMQLLIYGTAYLLAGWEVLQLSFRKIRRLDIFNEFVLMSVATLGAFAIGSFSEGVAVMVFYSIGEWFQDAAVAKAKSSIKSLLDSRPDTVNVLSEGTVKTIDANNAKIGDIVLLKAGEKVGLDGVLLSDKGTFNTAAITGESKPDTKVAGEKVFAGMINLNTVTQFKVSTLFKDSKLSRILQLVQDAAARKSQTQLFISRFARVYTPIVFGLAVLVVALPYFIADQYVFEEWLYRSLVFLVISCPCALVVSIPLGYFGGIGLASKNGILFKGSNFLDVMARVDTVVMDKTGTLTKGVFTVQKVVALNMPENQLVSVVAALESSSTHPIALAVTGYAGAAKDTIKVERVEEMAGRGLKGFVNGKEVFAGNSKLLDHFGISYDQSVITEEETVIVIAVDKLYAGYITIADEIKDDAHRAIRELHDLNVKTVMLSGDKQAVAQKVSRILEIGEAFGDLLPENKVEKLQILKSEGRRIAFVGDGINDAPVVALADAGIAMGGLGSDATIEIADIVIQNDQPSKIVTAIKISKLTKNIVWQNIALAMGVKLIVLSLGAGGIATLWEAVIADVGVALLAILNAVRIQQHKF